MTKKAEDLEAGTNPEEMGRFEYLLQRTFSQVKKARAQNMNEDAELAYRQHIESLKTELKKKHRVLENSLDYNPDTSGKMISAENFDADVFVKNDIDLALDIRDEEIMLEKAIERYKYLFGRDI